MLLAGSTIAGRFELVRLLGEGGMGEVWAATHVITRKEVALKFLKEGAARNPAAVRRFLREARAASAVRHPNVVEVHDVLEIDGAVPVMVMDLLVGESFASRLARERSLPLGEVARIMLPVLSALGTVHALGIVHRDLKPDNVFLERAGDGRTVSKVLDFGIAKLSATEGIAAQSSELTSTGSVMGTFLYMAPEQLFGEKDVDQRADVWSMGIMLYEALAGVRPIAGDNFGQVIKAIMTHAIQPLSAVMPELPEDVCKLVDRMLSSNRDERPTDLREVFELLGRYTDERTVSFAGERAPRPESQREATGDPAYAPTEASGPLVVPQRTSSRWRRRGWVAAAAVAALAAFVAGPRLVKQGEAPPPPKATNQTASGADAAKNAAATVTTAAARATSFASSAPPASASASASSSTSAAPPVSVSTSTLAASSSARPTVHPKPSTTARQTGVVPTATQRATSVPARLPGGIASSAPF